ncbi:hypothetical protein [Paractinoplanes brasiliensis]|uniref:Uncharacterized protein n=1 Tax=Paractinoplanes brasiliensis TaxID=52695 RepID=A0A4R6JBU3_9ACTN|nr:hypothetical protein [Actinoplanes brasiliensis]TDO31976.1 hypothetical protein C8E87_7415 [Actinoplanes brasiliensis]GID28020.1 hypothetical protein Abr02nite_30030 [Actinoplanes brasiliensis]
MSSGIRTWTAWGLCALTVVQLVGTAILAVLTRAIPDPTSSHSWLLNLVDNSLITAALAIVGVLLATRRPANPIGWLLTGVAFVWSTNDFTHHYARYALEHAPGSLPAGLATGWFASWNYALAFPLLPLLFLLFPDGRLPSPRWRPVGWAAAGAAVVLVVLSPLRLGPLEYFPTIRNPTGLVPPVVVIAIGLSFALLCCACAAALLVRLRQARGDERQQLKWVSAAGILLAAEGVVGGFFLPSRIHELLSPLTVVAFAAAIAVAVLKYRLYDIDVIIRRSVVYGSLTAAIAALYLMAAALGGVALSGRAAGPGIAAALAVALGLAPARAWLQRAADRLLYGERRDPLQAVTRLGDHVAVAPGPDLLAALLTGVQQAVNAAEPAWSGPMIAGSA